MLGGIPYNGFRTFIDGCPQALHHKMVSMFSAKFYVHVESMRFISKKSATTRPSQVLRPYFGPDDRKWIVMFTWQELMSIGVATELQIRRALHSKPGKALSRRKQHFVASCVLFDMLMHCNLVRVFYGQQRLIRRSNFMFARFDSEHRYLALSKAIETVGDDGLVNL